MKFMYGIKNTQNQTDKSFNSINSAGIPWKSKINQHSKKTKLVLISLEP